MVTPRESAWRQKRQISITTCVFVLIGELNVLHPVETWPPVTKKRQVTLQRICKSATVLLHRVTQINTAHDMVSTNPQKSNTRCQTRHPIKIAVGHTKLQHMITQITLEIAHGCTKKTLHMVPSITQETMHMVAPNTLKTIITVSPISLKMVAQNSLQHCAWEGQTG